MTKRGNYAVSIGVVYHRQTGKIVRIFNPTFEWELEQHHLSAHEFMLRVSKADRGISHNPDGMTLDDVHRLVGAMQ